MSNAQAIITKAYRRLGAIDILSQPSPALASHGLNVLSDMIASWPAFGVNIPIVGNQTLVGDVTQYSIYIMNLPGGNIGFGDFGDFSVITTQTLPILPGMLITGTGIPPNTLVQSIASQSSITMTQPATATNSGVSLLFSALPMDPRFEDGTVAMLAVRLAPDLNKQPSPILLQQATDGWNALQAAYITAPTADFDPALKGLSSKRYPSAF